MIPEHDQTIVETVGPCALSVCAEDAGAVLDVQADEPCVLELEAEVGAVVIVVEAEAGATIVVEAA